MIKKITFVSVFVTNSLFGFDLGAITNSVVSASTSIFSKSMNTTEVDKQCKNMFESYEINYGAALKVAALYAVSNSSSILNQFTSSSSMSLEEKSEAFKGFSKEIAKKSFWIPIEVEKLYGELAYKERLQDGNIILKNTKNKKYKKLYEKVDKFMKRYDAAIKDKNYPFDIKVVLVTKEKQAEATPYGYIFLDKNYVENGTFETILTHELSHISKRHVTKELQHRIVSSYTNVTDVMKMIKDMQDIKTYEKVFVVKAAAEYIKKSFDQYSQGQELEADACGLRKIVKIDGSNKNKYIKEIIANINYISQNPVLVKPEDTKKDHPSAEVRVSNIQELQTSL